MIRYILSLGSSDYLAFTYLENACDLIKKSGFIISAKSKIYKNCSLHTKQKLVFLNCCLAIKSNLSALMLYKELKSIEKKLGKITPYKNSPRSIDIDVLFSLDLTYKDDYFMLPHKELLNRDFFVIPAKEVLQKANWPISYKLYTNFHHRKQILEIIQ